MFGYSRAAAEAQAAIDRRLVALGSTETVAAFARTLAARPHVAGTPAQAQTRDFVLEQMRAWGLETSVAEYEIYLPHVMGQLLEQLAPRTRKISLSEPPIPGDAATADIDPFPQHGYAVAGDVQGELVYVNYARAEDLDALAGLGVDLRGRIALARYGEIFRGNKVLNVQRRGALGCVLFSDPVEDGFFRGDVYPVGPMRPGGGVQRGSLNVGAGDPTAPGLVSLPGVSRIAPAESPFLPRIPSLPISYDNAIELLRDIGGPEVPQEWQGGLPLRYHVGPGPARIRLQIESDDQYRRIYDTFGRIAGTEFPDEWILIGGHRDAWCCGAVDNVSGVVSVLEAARLCAELARAGQRPRRTLVFATWDAEEWGLVGSTEWVEQHADLLSAQAVAYINQDVAVCGPDFGGTASPSLARVLRAVADVIPSPDAAGKSVLMAATPAAPEPFEVRTPGGGSDHEPFFLFLGIPCASHGFGGRSGIYHSTYDTLHWQEKFGDPGYRRHRATAALTAAFALRLANADVLPLDYAAYGRAVAAAVTEVRPQIAAGSGDELTAAVSAFQAAAVRASETIDHVDGQSPAERQSWNHVLRVIERTLLRPRSPATAIRSADPEASFHRNLVFGVDPRSGYGGWTLPGVREALRSGDAAHLADEVQLLTAQLRATTALLQQA